MSDESLPQGDISHSAGRQGAEHRGRQTDAVGGNRLLVGVIGLVALIYCILVAVHSPLLFGQGEAAGAPHAGTHPPYWMVAPFLLLLGAIAVLPLAPHASHWWESN